MYAIDLHSHTRFFHGYRTLGDAFDPLGVRLLTKAAELRGLDAVATTNHDYYTPFDGSVDILPGIEVSSSKGHILVVGPNPPTETTPGELTPEEVVDIAHSRGCAAIIAHPYRNSTVRDVKADFDAIEINGKHPRTHEWVRRLARKRDLPLVGGSDAHYPVEVGRAYTTVDVETPTPENIVAAIRDGRVEPHVSINFINRLAHRGYKFTHGHKGWMTPPDAATPGIGDPPGDSPSESD
ncbi:CehA/McbA family metallohydrolase [Haladaptatus sp. CMSO5]|uniref:CehA/McbA family metallohydrolase n=1 Tax=Haladaptatus sp. CMSO5 TaxID=3120514 RepID=UPI002FCE2F30